MPTLPVHFRPRASLETVGTEWMPYGLDGRPFHLDFERVPPDATEREFQCSATLESYLVEFFHGIRPKLELPSLEGSPDICALFASHKSNHHGGMIRNMLAFRERAMRAMVAWAGTLPADATAQVVLGGGSGSSDEEILAAMRLAAAVIMSMRDELIELKVWVSIFTEVNDYLRHWTAYGEDLAERHSKLHDVCAWRLKLTGIGLPVYSPKPKIPPTTSRNSKLMPNAENRSRPPESMRRRPTRLERSQSPGDV